MRQIATARSSDSLNDAAKIMAAGILRARLRVIRRAGINAGNLPQGLDVFKDVSVHCDRPNVKGGAR